MADSHSSVERRTSQHISARQRLRQKEMLFESKNQDHGWTEVSSEKELGAKVRQNRGAASTNSGESSNRTRSTSATGYRTSLEVARGPSTPPCPERERKTSGSSLETSRLSPAPESEMSHEGDGFYVIPSVGDSPEPQRQPSPKSQIGAFLATHSVPSKNVYSGPLEKFLAQNEDTTELGSYVQKLQEEWVRLRGLRANTLRLRTQLREVRKKLFDKEFAKSRADEDFIKYVRLQTVTSSQPFNDPRTETGSTLEAYYTAMQMARDEYGPMNDDYNKLEDILDQQEFEMAKIEARLYNIHTHETPNFEPNVLGLSSDSPAQLPLIHIKYLSTLGDLDLAKERHQNMVQERDSLLCMQESKLRVGLELYEYEQEFLDQFWAREAAVLKEIADLQQDVERQRQECLEEGIDLTEDSLGDISGLDNEDASREVISDHG